MTKWILTAEANKIQHFVFRSSRLREVVGGSQLLTNFCEETTRSIPKADRIVAGGGSFTLLFDDLTQAKNFGCLLAQKYHELTGSTLAVATPIAWSGKPEEFQEANKMARLALAKAKREGRPAAALGQGPYTAFCASCGVGLANTHQPLVKGKDETAQYVCEVCLRKAKERGKQDRRFLLDFKQAVVGDRNFDLPTEPEDLTGAWEARNYIAYLVADGNSMGKVFAQCRTSEQLHDLSKGLKDVVLESLAAPTRQLLGQTPPKAKQGLIPVLPLILGGDDVFVLLTAAHALDFARRFCLEYEQRMAAKLHDLGLPDMRPTMSAAVVICKSKYPHTLVHKHGENLLKEAKRLSKAVMLREGVAHSHSVVHFDVILGSRLPHEADKPRDYQNSLAPYWVLSAAAASDFPENVGLPLDRLLDQRLALAQQHIPNRRLMQLRALYDPRRLPPNKRAHTLGLWSAELTRIKGRVARNKQDVETLEQALAQLGGTKDGYWLPINRPGATKEEVFQSHGLADLIQVWDFSWRLDQSRSVYAPREE